MAQDEGAGECSTLLSAEAAVSAYMDMHIADFNEAADLWEKSLYVPLRAYVKNVMSKAGQSDLHFVYVGSGRLAPLFDDPEFVKFFKGRVSQVTLVDISEAEVLSAIQKVQKIIPEIKWVPLVADVTGGAAQNFVDTASSLDLLADNIDIQDIAQKLGDFQFVSLEQSFLGAKLPKADIIYSEMVATFTGIPTVMSLQDKHQKTVNEAATSKRAELQNRMDERSIQLWQLYNGRAYLFQLQSMASVLNQEGLVAVATDTLKVYDDQSIPSQKSFSSGFPNAPGLLELPLGRDIEIWWIDEAHTGSVEEGVKSLEPHKHRVDLRTYRSRK